MEDQNMKNHLLEECGKLDQDAEQELAEEVLSGESSCL
jgi:hypothetical protein